MNPRETVELVQMVRGGCPGMEIVEGMPQVWHAVLEDLRLADCQIAVVNLVRRSARYIAPADIRVEVKRIRDKRLDAQVLPAPPADLTPIETIAWQKRIVAAIADGTYTPEPLALTRPMPELPRLKSPGDAA